MNARRRIIALLVLGVFLSGPGSAIAADPASPPPPPPPPSVESQAQPAAPGAPANPTAPAGEITPARVSYLNGEVSFWRPGASDWTPAKVNTPLAPGDVFYTGSDGTVELQVGPRAFVRAAPGAQIALDNHEPDYIQLRLSAGHAALDIRELDPGDVVELATPGAAFTVERNGFYHAEVTDDTTTFRAHRAGSATMTPSGGAATPVAANEQVMVIGTESPRVVVGAAPSLTAWDQWNYQRTDYLIQPASARYVPSGVYGTETLDQHGSWRAEEGYGNVWVPRTVAPGWVPYSTGRWIWDPRFGWTWLDDAPWGWAPYHYGRWVFVHNYWAWAPGPIVVRPVYSPALVVFLGGGVHIGVSLARPVYWAPLGWGEPCIPWWGRPGFVGVASWHGWGGPRVVNNVVVRNTTVVNVQNINVYRNVTVNNAVVSVPADRFGRGEVAATRVNTTDVRQLAPVRGAPEVRPVAASVAPSNGSAAKPPANVQNRRVVATRAPRDQGPALREQGLPDGKAAGVEPAPKLVAAPVPTVVRSAPARRDIRPPQAAERTERNDGADRARSNDRSAPAAPRVRDEGRPEPKQGAPVQSMPAPAPAPRVRDEGRPEVKQSPPAPPTGRPEARQSPPAPPTGRPEVKQSPPALPTGRPEAKQSPPAQPTVTPAPVPAPRGRDEGRPEPRQSAPARPTPPAPAAPAPRPQEEARPQPRVSPPAPPAVAPAPQPGPPARIERPAQSERTGPPTRPAPAEKPAPAQPEPRTHRFEPVAPAIGASGAHGGKGQRDNRETVAVPEPGPRTKIRD
jgi:Family of unknown function (DUF6600)